jgi:pimeloyl-ACP methyl ester carboxylesterase
VPSGSYRVVAPDPPQLGTLEGLAYALFTPAGGAPAGVVILHGAGSSKESHYDFARQLRAHGLAAVCFDQRGHGESKGALDDRLVDDVAVMRTLLPDGPVGLRGSSMGGWLALAAAERVRATAVVAICPASSALLLRGLRTGRFDFEADRPALDRVLATYDLEVAARSLGERLLLLHADGDEQVPVEHSQALHAVAPGSRLVVVPGGHHRSVQHDSELQAFSVRFLRQLLLGTQVR